MFLRRLENLLQSINDERNPDASFDGLTVRGWRGRMDC